MISRHSADVLITLVERDLKVRYRHSVLGIVWSQLGPLALLVMMSFVFMRVVPLHIAHYPLFVIIGLLAWTWFASAVQAGTGSIAGSRELLERPGLAPSALPTTAVLTQSMNFVFALPVLVVADVVVLGRLPVTIVALPLIAVAQLALTLGPAWALAALNVRWRDVGHGVTILLMPLFYATAVFYPPDHVPAHWRTLFGLNPLSRLFTAYREVLIAGRWPSWTALAAVAVAGAVLAALAHRFVVRRAHSFAEEA